MSQRAGLLLTWVVLLSASSAEAQDDDAWLDALEDEVEAEQAEQEAEEQGAASDGASTEAASGGDDWLADLEAEVDAEEGAEAETPLVLPLFGETTFSLTDTTILEYRRNPAEEEGGFALVLTEKLDLAAQGEDLRLSMRIDAFAPFKDADCNVDIHSLCTLDYDLRVPERVTLLWEPGDWTMELGDSYAVFGRGVALSFRKVDLLGIDTTLRGGHVQYDGDVFTLELLGGLANPQNIDPITLETFDDPKDVVAGASAGLRLGGDGAVEVGAHAARVWFEESAATDVDVSGTVFGWRIGAPSLLDGHLALYGEANAMVRQGPLRCPEDRCWGRAVYGSAQVNAGDLSILFEWKDYRDYLLAPNNSVAGEPWRVYSAAPTLDRDTERLRGLHNSRGGALQVDYALAPGPWSVAVNGIVYGHEDEDPTRDPWDGILVTHGYATVRRQNQSVDQSELGWSLEMSGGYRRETWLGEEPIFDVQAGDLDWRVVHGEVDLTVGKGEHSFELLVEHRDERRLFLEYVEYVRGGVSLTWSWAGEISVSPMLRWSTEKKTQDTFYPGGEVRWEFREGSHVRLFGGRTPGGRICSGGVCRDVPPFEGVLGELVLRL